MFISSKEKETLTLRIAILEDQMLRVSRILNTMQEEKQKLSDSEKLKKRTAYARAYYQRKKAEKLAQNKEAVNDYTV